MPPWSHARRIERRLRCSALILALAVTPAAAAGQLTVDGFVAARGTFVRSQPSWREGAFGRPILGADSADDEETWALGQLHVALDWQPSPFFGAFVHATARAEPSEVEGDDAFEVVDVDRGGADDNDEDGSAWTFAVFVEPRDALRLGVEVSNLDADRPAAAEAGFDPDTDVISVQVELRYYFGW